MKKFQSNRIKFLLEQRIEESSAGDARDTLLEQLRAAMDCTPTKLTRLLNNSDRPTADELVAAAQVLNVTLDELVKLTDPEPATAAA